jgi:hypothetical protein
MTLILNGTDNSATTPAVTGTDTDTGVYYPAANQVALATNGTLALIVDASQNVGLGVTPSTWSLGKALEINTVGQGVWATSTATALANNWYYNGAYKFAGTGYASRVLLSGQFGSIDVSNASGTAGNNITFSSSLAFGYNQTVALQGASQSAGTGITFPATQSASSDANTLDDYEEGTWTPTFTGSVSNPTVTYSTQTGSYTKVGRQVTCTGRVSISSASGGSGQVQVAGLPFANAGAQLGFFAMQGSTSSVLISAYIDGAVTNFRFYGNAPANAFATFNLPLPAGIDLIYTFSYFAS